MKTLLIGLDGATFTILDELMETGVMPFLRQLTAEGTRAELLSTPHPLTCSAWTSLATGMMPGRHGVFDFVRPEETAKGIFIKLTDSRDIRAETIWMTASRQNRRVTCLNYPMTFPPPAVKGTMISGFMAKRHVRSGIYPKERYEELKNLPGIHLPDIAWDLEMEKKSIQSLPLEEYEEWIQTHIRSEQQRFAVLKHLMQTDPADLTSLVFDGVDHLQHLAWRFIDTAFFPSQPTAWEQRIRDLCLEYFRVIDGCIREIVALAGEDARVFIASDHGFGPTWDIFYLNKWLHDQGYLFWGVEGAPLDQEDNIMAARFKMLYGLVDWEKTTAYALAPSGNGIYIRVADRQGKPGIAPHAYEDFRRELIAKLSAVADPETGEPIVREIMTRDNVFAGEQMELAPDLTLVLRDHGFISVLNAETPLKRRTEPKGMHRPSGVFLAAGPNIRRGYRARPLSIVDVCPALLYSLGLDIPCDLDGKLPGEIFEASALAAAPPRLGGLALRIDSAGETESSPAEQAAALARLQQLDYL